MSSKKKKRRKEKSDAAAQTEPVANRSRVRDTAILAVVAAVGVVLGMGWWNYQHPSPDDSAVATTVKQSDDEPASDEPGHDEQQTEPTESHASSPAFAKLQGQWVRADGGYIIDIKSIDEHGKLDAAYLNPNPIHIAKAEATSDGAALKVFVELRDVNYPGSTYDLRYDGENDRLVGEYFQAVEQQRFDVTFERAK